MFGHRCRLPVCAPLASGGLPPWIYRWRCSNSISSPSFSTPYLSIALAALQPFVHPHSHHEYQLTSLTNYFATASMVTWAFLRGEPESIVCAALYAFHGALANAAIVLTINGYFSITTVMAVAVMSLLSLYSHGHLHHFIGGSIVAKYLCLWSKISPITPAPQCWHFALTSVARFTLFVKNIFCHFSITVFKILTICY